MNHQIGDMVFYRTEDIFIQATYDGDLEGWPVLRFHELDGSYSTLPVRPSRVLPTTPENVAAYARWRRRF